MITGSIGMIPSSSLGDGTRACSSLHSSARTLPQGHRQPAPPATWRP